MLREIEVHPIAGYEAGQVERVTGGRFIHRRHVQTVLEVVHNSTEDPLKRDVIRKISMMLGVEIENTSP